MNVRLVLRNPYGQEPVHQSWDCQIVDNKIVINRNDLQAALHQGSGFTGRFDRTITNYRLELQTMSGDMLRTSEQLQKAIPQPPPLTQPQP